LGYSDGGQVALELGMRYPGLAGALVLGGTQFRFSEAYLEDVRALLGITDGEEVDTGKLEREQPDWAAYLREAHGHVYGPEYWKTYVKQIAALWLTPLRYTSEDFAAVTDPVLLFVGDRDGVSTKSPSSCSGCSPTRSSLSPRPRITASSRRKWASSTRSPWISSCGIGNEPAAPAHRSANQRRRR